MNLHCRIVKVSIMTCMFLVSSFAFADEKYPSDQTAEENPYVLQPSVPPQPETLLPKLRTGDEKNYAELYGWINKALLIHDDGNSTLGYFPVDNDAGGTRAGIRLRTKTNNNLVLGINLEIEWEPYSTATVDQTMHGDPNADINKDTVGWRKGEIGFRHVNFGRLLIGQGPSAADNASQVDFSGTISAGYSAVAIPGGCYILFDDNSFSSLRWRSAVPNFDGFCCIARLRYDSPIINGFSLAGSIGEDIYPERTHETVKDLALTYNAMHGDFKTGGAIAYSDPDESGNHIVNGSFSILHNPTGFNFTVAGALAKMDSRDVGFIYVKPGYQGDFYNVGKTAFSIDAYYGKNIITQDSTSLAAGLQVVQYLDYLKSEIYIGYRWLDYDDDAGKYNSAQSLLTGVRVRF